MDILTLADVELVIPAWQMALYIFFTTIFMLRHDRKMCLIATYFFTLYWGFYLYGNEFIRAANGSPPFLSVYILCGMLHLFFTLIAFLQEK